MKKMSKFRVWLIRKLGGEIILPTPPPRIIVERRPSVTLCSSVSITNENIRWLKNMFGEHCEDKVKKKLWEALFDKAKDLLDVQCYRNEELNTVECRCKITIVKEQDNG